MPARSVKLLRHFASLELESWWMNKKIAQEQTIAKYVGHQLHKELLEAVNSKS
jgi:hypothetical protein